MMKITTPIVVGIIVFAVIISYGNIFVNDFAWDDHIFILENSDIRSFSNLPAFFTEGVDGLYRPLRTAYYTFMYSFAGSEPFWYHANSLVLHTLISLLVFFIIFTLFNKRNLALLASVIFAVHPIHTGRVTNITASFDMLGILFFLLSFYLYILFRKNNTTQKLLLSILFFIFALLSSEEAITFPILILLYEYCFHSKNFKQMFSKTKIKNYFLFVVPAFFYVILRFFILGMGGRNESYLAGSFFLTMLTMVKVIINYILLLLLPIKLSVYHDIMPAISLFDLNVLFSGIIAAGIIAAAIKYRNNVILFFSVFWFFITLLPVSNILPLQVFMAERYLYVPSIGFSMLLAYLFLTMYKIADSAKFKGGIKAGLVVALIVLLSFYVIKTIDRNTDFKDDLTLWTKTLETNPDNSRTHDNLGFTLERMGKIDGALPHFEKAVQLQPDNFRALANLGAVYGEQGRYEEAIDLLELSLSIQEIAKTYDKLGLIYAELEQEEKAIAQFQKAIDLKPRYAKAYNDLGTVYGRIGQFDLALGSFDTAIELDRTYADAHYNKGILLEFLQEEEKALEHFRKATELEPDNKVYLKKLK